MPVKTKKPAKKAQKSLYLDRELWGKIAAKAESENHSINSYLELLLRKQFS